MRTVTAWTDRIPENEGVKPSINGIAFRPDGSQLIAAVGTRVIIYDAAVGDLIHSLKGHKDTVYCVAYAKDGKRFASGGADKTVIIWTTKGEGILKYQHNESIQCLSYNPASGQLASATALDFGIWNQEQKNVGKHKLGSKALCCAWTLDGQHLAIGLFNGVITIRDKSGGEKLQIKRQAPVWTIAWNPSREESMDILAVGTWDQKLSLYHLSGKQIGRDRELKCDPCSISYFSDGAYMVVGGSDKKVGLYTKEGIFLVQIAECEDWVWSACQRPKVPYVALGTNDGLVAMHQLIFQTVHGIYHDQYAYRELMTDIVIQHLITDKKLRIKCKDYVKKIAIYKDRLAVQLPEKLIVYELYHDDQFDLKYKVRDKINKQLDCNLLVTTATNIVLCQEKRLQLYDFSGIKRREWYMDSVIRYIKVVGGLTDREALLAGMKNGVVMKIFVDNPFPIQLLKLDSPVRCLDMSASRSKVAVVDEGANCKVYSLKSKEMLFQEANANSVAWNTEFDDMLCYSGNGMLNIKTGNLPSYQQKLQGFVVGFKANKVFCLHYTTMSTVDVPQSHALYRYVENKNFEKAYEIACLGITENDWKMLAMHALTHMELSIARKAFIRIRDVKYVELLNRVEQDRKVPGMNEAHLMGDILAYQGKYAEASKAFCKCGLVRRAIEMYCDMKMWDEAKAVCAQDEASKDEHMKELVRRQAKWAEETSDDVEASKLWLDAGDYTKAIHLMGSKGAVDQLIEVCRLVPRTDVTSLTECGNYFRKHKAHAYAVEAFEKIGDFQSLLQIHVEMNKWDEAFRLLESYPQYASDLYVPYAQWLAMNDRFDEAQEAFKKANRPDQALNMVEQLAYNMVTMNKFGDAGYYFYNAVSESAAQCPKNLSPVQLSKEVAHHNSLMRRAELYYVYDMIYQYCNQPFTSTDLLTLFNACKYLVNALSGPFDTPPGIKKLDVLTSLAKLSVSLEMYKLARTVHEKLQQFVIPLPVLDMIDIASLSMRAKPYVDREDMLPMCYRCSYTNPSFNANGDHCVQCLHPFVRSFHSFEVLPLVEFRLEDGLTDAEAEHIISTNTTTGRRPEGGEWKEKKAEGGADVMTFEDELVEAAMATDAGDGHPATGDPFQRQLMQLDFTAGTSKQYQPLIASQSVLKSLKRDEVYVVRRRSENLPVPNLYYRNILPELCITMCPQCAHLFNENDYEFQALKCNGCPFCRHKKTF